MINRLFYVYYCIVDLLLSIYNKLVNMLCLKLDLKGNKEYVMIFVFIYFIERKWSWISFVKLLGNGNLDFGGNFNFWFIVSVI